MATSLSEITASRPMKDCFDNLSKAIRKGHFTPFLGAGASSLRAKATDLSSPPWNQVMKTIVAIYSQLKTERSLSFIRSFSSQRLGLSREQLDQELPLPDDSAVDDQSSRVDSIFERNGLVQLQVELVLATVRLTDYFGTRFSQETPSIHDLPSCSVPFEPKIQEADDAVRQLLKAAAIAQDLQRDHSWNRESPFLREYPGVHRSFEIQVLYEKLLTLIVILLADQRKTYDSELARHRLGGELPVPAELWTEGTSDIGRLRLDAVQWMSELVWYTLRYWIPCYPTSAELAFELSLRVSNAPPRRAELAQAAQAIENQFDESDSETLATQMAGVIRYCEKYQAESPESARGIKTFYYAISAAMQHQYDLFFKKTHADPMARYRNDTDAAERVEGAIPTVSIVFTTNFDNALENVFKENDLGYHVVYPTVGDNGKKNESPTWWLRTCYPETQDASEPDIPWDEMPTSDTGQPQAGQLIGPLIIKIHGAPCLTRIKAKAKHWVVLSEAGYLQALASATNMPEWFSQQLGAGIESHRSLWFLGYSISDWNVRLRLFEHCKEGNKGFRSAVDREADVYRTALLLDESIRVEPWLADLDLLPRRLLHMFKDIQKSAKVTLLTEKLQRLLEGGR